MKYLVLMLFASFVACNPDKPVEGNSEEVVDTVVVETAVDTVVVDSVK